MKWTGLVFIQQPGVYHFQITCMGAAELRLGEGEFTLQIPANHGPAARIDGSILIKEDTLLTQRASIPSNPVTLPAGHHAILIGYTELEGQAGFAINYIGPDTQNMLKLIPAHALMHEKGPCDLRSILGADNIACGDKDRPRWALSSGESCEALGLGLGRPYRGKHPGTGMDGMDVWGNQRACAVISQAPKLSL
eukprot:symbB.v1.2.031154.t1/scaffold3585.1/size53677/2